MFSIENCKLCSKWDPDKKDLDRIGDCPGEWGNCEAAHEKGTLVNFNGIDYKEVHQVIEKRIENANKPSKIKRGVHRTHAHSVCNVTFESNGEYAFSPIEKES